MQILDEFLQIFFGIRHLHHPVPILADDGLADIIEEHCYAVVGDAEGVGQMTEAIIEMGETRSMVTGCKKLWLAILSFFKFVLKMNLVNICLLNIKPCPQWVCLVLVYGL